MLGVIVGVLLGPDLGLISADTVKTIIAWLALPWQVFLAIIQMIVASLVVASIVRELPILVLLSFSTSNMLLIF